MRLYLLTLLLLFSCMEASVDTGNGGTSIDGKEVQGPQVVNAEQNGGLLGDGPADDPDNASLLTTYHPKFETFGNNSDQTTSLIFKVALKDWQSLLDIEAISANGVDLRYSGYTGRKQEEHTFRVNLEQGAAVLSNFELIFKENIPQDFIKSIRVFSDSDKLLFQAIHIDDDRARIYNGSKRAAFVMSVTSCPSGEFRTNLGVCRPKRIKCSDQEVINASNDGSTFCHIKRDDGKTIACPRFQTRTHCINYMNTACLDLAPHVTYDNQLFWAELEGEIVKNIQCLKN